MDFSRGAKKAPRPRSNRARGGISPSLPVKEGLTSWLGGGPGVPTVKVLYYIEIFILIKKKPQQNRGFR
jgi:hypothetical protein